MDCSAVKPIKKAAMLHKSFRPLHGLRHHYAVQLASSGEFILDMIGKLLTHKDSAITQRYAHFLPEAQQAAAEKAARILAGTGIPEKENETQVVKLRKSQPVG